MENHYCRNCEAIVTFDDAGYCKSCGAHFDNVGEDWEDTSDKSNKQIDEDF